MRKLLCTLMVAAFGAAAATAQSELVNGIAVITNEGIITYKDVQAYIGPAIDLLQRQFGRQPEVLKQKILDAQKDGIEQLVERQLILHDFIEQGYNLPESIIEDEIKRDIKERFNDRLTLTKTLAAQGMTFEAYKKQTRERFIVEALRAKNVFSEILISPYKIESFYQTNRGQFKVEDQVKLRMIVLNKPAGPAGEAKAKLAAELARKLEEGANFAELAGIYSDGSQKSQGGDWGWVERPVLRKELADVAFTLKAGQRSGVIETPEAVYLMLVEDRKEAHLKSMKEVVEEIERMLITQERTRLQKKYVDRLKRKSFVRYF